MDLKDGSIIENKFEILERIGAGGMGTVYKAKDLTLLRTFVLKILSPSYNSSKAFLRFQNEAKVLGKMQHPGIADIYNVGVTSDGLAYLALEFVDGVTLDSFIKCGENIPLSQIIQIFIEIADALSHAHSVGIIHRDIKPGNIMLVKTDDGFFAPVLLDFGIAKFDTADDAEQRLTEVGAMIGSPLYMSPEQCKGETVTAASDQYSLGCVLFECLAGAPPFRGDTAYDTALIHISRDCPDPVAASKIPISKELGDTIKKMLEKVPSDRFESIDELVKSMIAIREQAIEQEHLIAQNKLLGEKRDEHYFRNFVSPKWLVLCLVIAVLAGVGIFAVATEQLKAVKHKSVKPAVTFEKSEDIILPAGSDIKLQYSLMTPIILKQLSERTDLTRLDLSYSETTDEMLKVLEPSKDKLSELILRATRIRSLEQLPALKNVGWLILSNTEIDDQALRNTVELKRLNILEIDSCKGLTKASLQTFESYPQIRLIKLEETNFQKADIVKLQQRMPRTVFTPFLEKAPVTELRELAVSQSKQGNFEKSLKTYDHAITVLCDARGRDCAQATDLLLEAAAAAIALKREKAAKEYIDHADRCAQKSGDKWLQISVLGTKMGFAGAFTEDVKKHLALLREQLKLIKDVGQEDSDLGRNNMLTSGLILLNTNHLDEAELLIKKCAAFDLSRSQNKARTKAFRKAAQRNYGVDLHALGRIALQRADYSAAEKFLLQALKLVAPKRDSPALVLQFCDLNCVLADAINRQNRPIDALKYMEAAVQEARSHGLSQTATYESALENVRRRAEQPSTAD